jgi:hypothetical protein
MANASLLNIPQFLGPDYSGYTFSFYEPSTTTSKIAYASSSGSSGASLSNPLTLNSNGSTTTGIWGTGFYRVILKDSTGVTVFDWDNVSGADAASSSVSSDTLLDPSLNLIRNSSFVSWPNSTTTLTGQSDGTQTASFWYGLTQSGNFDAALLTSAATGLTNSAIRLTNTHSTTQRLGLIGISPVSVSEARIGQTVTSSAYIRTDIGQTIRIALCAAISTASPTVDIVSNWAVPTFTESNFFISSANFEVIAVSSTSTVSDVWKTISISGTVPDSTTGIYMFIWTDSVIAVNSRLDIASAALYESSASLTWRPQDSGLDTVISAAASNLLLISDSDLTVNLGNPATAKTYNFTPVMFKAYRNTTQSLTTNVTTKAQLNTEDFDIGGYFDNATNYRFTPLQAGYYTFHYHVNVSAPIGNAGLQASISKNGSTIALNYAAGGSSGVWALTTASSSVTTTTYMNGSTDYIEFYVYHDATSTKNASSGIGEHYATGYLIHPLTASSF